MSERPTSGLITGTSSEFLSTRPVRRLLRERCIVVVAGPGRSGKSVVGERLASVAERPPARLDGAGLIDALVERARDGRWSEALRKAPSLLIDGPQQLTVRPGAANLLSELLQGRCKDGLRTVVCEAQADGSIDALLRGLPVGKVAVLGLRFPRSRSGRMRFARRCCDELDLPRTAAHGSDAVEPWGYAEVVAFLHAKRTR